MTSTSETPIAEPVEFDPGLVSDASLAPGDPIETESTEPVQAEAAPVDIAPDTVLLAARDIARAALAEITDEQTIGADEGFEVHGERVLSLFFECRLPGYPGWHWTATLSRLEDADEVNVLEVELLPGSGAVVAPDWVPWSERLAQYREAQARQAADEAAAAENAAAELADEDEVDPEDDLLDNDFSDFDDEIDGVDIDDLDSDDDFDDEDDVDDDDDEDDSDDEADEDAEDESDDGEEEDSEDDDSDLDDEE